MARQARVPPTAKAKPERIDPAEFAYYKKLQDNIQAAQVAWQSFAAHMAEAYQLTGEDRITPEGEIVRAPAA